MRQLVVAHRTSKAINVPILIERRNCSRIQIIQAASALWGCARHIPQQFWWRFLCVSFSCTNEILLKRLSSCSTIRFYCGFMVINWPSIKKLNYDTISHQVRSNDKIAVKLVTQYEYYSKMNIDNVYLWFLNDSAFYDDIRTFYCCWRCKSIAKCSPFCMLSFTLNKSVTFNWIINTKSSEFHGQWWHEQSLIHAKKKQKLKTKQNEISTRTQTKFTASQNSMSTFDGAHVMVICVFLEMKLV